MAAIFLIGFMCSGKTTLGKALAERLGVAFTDLDRAIEARLGISIAEIFSTHGEAGFREIETQTLQEVLQANPDGVIALGGGTPCREGAPERLNAAGITVWLVPSRQRLIARLMQGRRGRPLLAGIDTADDMCRFVATKMSEREKYYSLALRRFDSSFLETEQEISQSVQKFIKEILTYT